MKQKLKLVEVVRSLSLTFPLDLLYIVSIFTLFRPGFFALLIQAPKLHIVMYLLFPTLMHNLTETMTHLKVQFKLYSFLTHIALRWLPRVFINKPSYLAYVTEGSLVTLSLRFCSQLRFTA